MQSVRHRGTDYFGQQQKTNNFDPIWDKGDNYKSPFELRWTLYYKDKTAKPQKKRLASIQNISPM